MRASTSTHGVSKYCKMTSARAAEAPRTAHAIAATSGGRFRIGRTGIAPGRRINPHSVEFCTSSRRELVRGYFEDGDCIWRKTRHQAGALRTPMRPIRGRMREQEQEQLMALANFADAAPDLLMVLDPKDLRVLDVTNRAAAIGYGPDQLVGKSGRAIGDRSEEHT